jgi:hypothetical protein
MHAYSTAEWQSLFVAEVGASAALAGLLFVAISINLARILQGAGLSGRAGEAMVLLVAGLVAWSALVTIHVRAVRGQVGPSSRVLAGRIVLAQTAVVPVSAFRSAASARRVGSAPQQGGAAHRCPALRPRAGGSQSADPSPRR